MLLRLLLKADSDEEVLTQVYSTRKRAINRRELFSFALGTCIYLSFSV